MVDDYVYEHACYERNYAVPAALSRQRVIDEPTVSTQISTRPHQLRCRWMKPTLWCHGPTAIRDSSVRIKIRPSDAAGEETTRSPKSFRCRTFNERPASSTTVSPVSLNK